MELFVDTRWLLERQAELLPDDLAVNDLSILAGMAQRHRVNTPHLDHADPDAFWRAAVFLEECVLLRPLPVRNEYYGVGLATAYLGACGHHLDVKFEAWRDLISDIQGLRLDSYGIAERLRAWSFPASG